MYRDITKDHILFKICMDIQDSDTDSHVDSYRKTNSKDTVNIEEMERSINNEDKSLKT